jgi:hypothetical protein
MYENPPHPVTLITFSSQQAQRFISSTTFLSPFLSGPAHLLRWVVRTDVAFYFMLGARQQTYVGLLLVAPAP